MAQSGQEQWIMPTTGSTRLPTVELLTGRGFVTGKSGSGKSNTASVILEELLELKFNLLIVDIEGEYYGLKDRYDLVHAGADDRCDITVGVSDAADIAELALVMNMPVVLDISEFADPLVGRELVTAVVEELYVQEKAVRKPFLLVVEEMQEFMPQTGGGDELSNLLERVAKRGRKRGLGMLGLSQRPSSVDKNFITQCDWMVWHRVTWKTDLDIVRNILGAEKAQQIEDVDTGEGFLMTDWDEQVRRVQFKKKRTHDAGATPGLESYETPPPSVVSDRLAEKFDTDGIDLTPTIELPAESEEDAAADEQSDEDAAEGGETETVSRAALVATVRQLQRENAALRDELAAVPEEGAEPTAPAESAIPDLSAQAPERPPEREGAAGTLLELTELALYLSRLVIYRLRSLAR
jgi:Predicted ATPase